MADVPVRVFIVADNSLVRAGLANVLTGQVDIVGQSANEAHLLSTLEIYRPDVVLWDLAWTEVGETDQLADVVESQLPVLAILNDTNQAPLLWQMGVQGLLWQETDPLKIETALNAVALGLMVIDQTLAPLMQTTTPNAAEILPEALTPRELEVLQLIAEGLSNKAIAYALNISDHTVKFHVTAIMTKLSAQSRTEAVVRATRLGLIHL